MVRILLTPQHSPLGYRFDYEYRDEKIQVTLRQREAIVQENEVGEQVEVGEVWHEVGQDVFDFAALPDGRIENPEEDVRTDLLFNPIVSAERIEGELSVVLLHFVGENPSEEERFPEWFEVKSNG